MDIETVRKQNRIRAKRYYVKHKDEIKARKQKKNRENKKPNNIKNINEMSNEEIDDVILSMNNIEEQFVRSEPKYTEEEEYMNNLNKNIFMAENAKISSKEPISEEQEITAKKILVNYKDGKKLFTMVFSPTQSGKTGVNRETFKKMVEMGVPVENLYYITGKSDKNLKIQTQKRMPQIIEKNIFHGPELKKFVKSIEGKNNCVIVLDECQYACRENNCLAKALKEAGMMDKTELYRRNIHIILTSATPNGTLYDLQNWGEETYSIIYGIAGKTYMSCVDLYCKGRVKDAKDLMEDENLKEFGEKIIEYDQNGNDPLYHIIRAYNGLKFHRLKDRFNKYFDDLFCFLENLQDTTDINNILIKKPTKHTIIFIKEKLRCGNTLFKQHVGILYERPQKGFVDDSVIIQGLLGRACGYDDNGKLFIYSNTESIIRYLPFIEGGYFNPDYNDWNSSSTRKVGDKIEGKETFTDPAHYKGTGVSRRTKSRIQKPEAFHIILNSFEELRECYRVFNNGTNRRGPNKIKKNENGFVLGTIRNYSNRVLSLSQVIQEKNNAINDEKKPCSHKPCYIDVNNSETLRFVFIHNNPEFSFIC